MTKVEFDTTEYQMVTKTLIEGNLAGITLTERTTVAFEVGKTYGGGWTGPRYMALKMEKVK